MYDIIKYDFLKFLTLCSSACFVLYTARSFWDWNHENSKIICYSLIILSAILFLFGLSMISKNRFEKSEKLFKEINKDGR